MTSSMQPAELVMFGGAVGLEAAGIDSTMFIPSAPLAACRLCGAVYQTKYHRELFHSRQHGDLDPPELLQLVLQLGDSWRENHTKSKHTVAEVEEFTKTGWAFTPEAANVLAPFGIIPMGNMTQEHIDALFEAKRAPDLTSLEGGE